MPALPMFFRDLFEHEDPPLTAARVGSAFDGRPVRELKVIAEQASDLLGEGMGQVLVEEGLPREAVPAPITAKNLKDHAGFAALLGGAVQAPGAGDKATIHLIQRALQAVAARVPGSAAAMRMTGWGADRGYGQETVAAVAAFQRARDLPVDGKVSSQVAQALVDVLGSTTAPDLWKMIGPRISAGAARLVEVARGMVAATPEARFQKTVDGRTYSYYAALFGTQPAEAGKLEAPGGLSYGLQPGTSYWKCNIFAGTCIALAGLPVAKFRWSARVETLHFPRAEKFGDRLAELPGWTRVRYLDHRDPDDETRPLVGTTQDAEIDELLSLVRPGDVLFVDHPGAPGNDGGHCRVAVEAAGADDPDNAPAFAQASYEQATIQRDGLQELAGGREIQFWLLRYTR